MEIIFADTFIPSLKRMIARQRWYWQTWYFFKIYMPNFFRNLWKFRRALYRHQWWDHSGALMFLKTALEDISVHIEKEGNEEPESRDKKVNMMKRAVAILHNVLEDRYIEMAEEELGKLPDMDIFGEITEQEHAVFERARELENSEWKELWQIIEGNENDVFDGSGLRGWWD